jgi:hypothetical protein
VINGRFESYEDVKREFDRLSFTWPGFTLELIEPSPWLRSSGPDIGLLRITMDVLDSRGSGRTILVGRATVVTAGMTAKWFPDWVFHQIFDLLRHEAQEHFRQDGVIFHDPHQTT